MLLLIGTVLFTPPLPQPGPTSGIDLDLAYRADSSSVQILQVSDC